MIFYILVLLFLMIPSSITYAENVTAPSVVYPPAPTQANTVDMASYLGIAGAIITYIVSKMNDKKAAGERGELLDGGLAIANVANQMVNSLKETDYSDQDQARLFNYLIVQLNKVPAFNEVLNEKLKTSDTDLLINNKSILQASQDNLNQIIRDNKQYYENLMPSRNDTCDNRLVRSVSRAEKMTSKN